MRHTDHEEFCIQRIIDSGITVRITGNSSGKINSKIIPRAVWSIYWIRMKDRIGQIKA